ncbi:hypothetical protein SS05631_b64360 (plasmid) [Sinorhizobium sp. CCBAU 05631]|nr:hypothetical protein SS05631_b64360 [Sinorhizobium sp. CCBAU 05631]
MAPLCRSAFARAFCSQVKSPDLAHMRQKQTDRAAARF